MKEEKMPLIMKHIVWFNLASQWRYLTDKTGFLFIGTHCMVGQAFHSFCQLFVKIGGEFIFMKRNMTEKNLSSHHRRKPHWLPKRITRVTINVLNAILARHVSEQCTRSCDTSVRPFIAVYNVFTETWKGLVLTVTIIFNQNTFSPCME